MAKERTKAAAQSLVGDEKLIAQRTSVAIDSKAGKVTTNHIKVGDKHYHFIADVEIISKMRAIGNSKGVIFSNQLLEISGIEPAESITIQARKGVITITQEKKVPVNTDLSTWDAQFKIAINKGNIPDEDIFEGINNKFDSKEW